MPFRAVSFSNWLELARTGPGGETFLASRESHGCTLTWCFEGQFMKNDDRKLDEKKFRQVSRRELLKLTPVLALGAFAIPKFQEGLLKRGLGFSDWASARLFRAGHLATTFDAADLTPFAKFPINGYDVDDPGVIFENWTLTVSGAVQRPGEYKL